MASDISRNTFDSKKHYSSVRLQQGRVQLDSDWNEQLEIEQYRTHIETIDTIGAVGVPKAFNGGNSFKISAAGTQFNVAKGRIYVGGLLCELEDDVAYDRQPYFPHLGIHPPSSPPAPLLAPGVHLVYIDAWQQEINHLDDPDIREMALGGPDTATRLQTVWQIKTVLIRSNLNPDCKSDLLEWRDTIAPPSGTLEAKALKQNAPTNHCDLPPQSGYRRLENQLYRVEIHRSGSLGAATFKWSRDNATVETSIIKIDGKLVSVADLGKDEVLGFAAGQWIEIVDDFSSLNRQPYDLRKIVDIDEAERIIELDQAPGLSIVGKAKIRRWDQSGALATLPASGSVALEGGIEVTFSGGAYQAGDYWLIPARTALGDIEWPGGAQLPAGVRHQYGRLALVRVLGAAITLVTDCRPIFPALTGICAEDVCYDNRNCTGSTAKTVQEALDELCRRKDSACTYIALPGQGWEAVFGKIRDGEDAQICFQVGEYPLDKTVDISKKGHLKLNGCGLGTRILAPKAECALVFNSCKSVLVRDLYAETGTTGASVDNQTTGLNGTLRFVSCPEVQVETVDLKCGSGKSRAASCLRVADAKVVRVLNCDLQVGHFQQGILLTDVIEAFVERNTLKTYARPGELDLQYSLQDRKILSNMKRAVFSGWRVAEAVEKLGNRNVSLNLGGRQIAFRTSGQLKPVMTKILKEAASQNFSSDKALHKYMDKTVGRLFLDADFRKRYGGFETYYLALAAENRSVATMGITIGGTQAKAIKIQNNTLEDFMQGIHVGLSHQDARNVHDHAQSVQILHNNIGITLASNTHKMGRHGIFVGNCADLLIENNTIILNRLSESEYIFIDGIRVWGILGHRLMITKNLLHSSSNNPRRSFDIGINVMPIIPKDHFAQWVVTWNVAPSKQQTVLVANGALDVAGTNNP